MYRGPGRDAFMVYSESQKSFNHKEHEGHEGVFLNTENLP